MEEPKEEVKDEFLCKICFQLLLQPATIACGNYILYIYIYI